ncbi:MAG TPA: hypothetical protein VNQ78_18630 [Paracoccus sp. (in: a-proteobacteria)]|uniref:NfeD family protein n=1 Tax=Paracoccus sp. TaxID=267 RepID=UPI002D04C2C6|nr:hypothetical protein [Paracoccus sp. (in: a-proteobacteria)]HWL58674.1 hypothetical protein [Paracoccus sp. (in: a-proteobacteria)]
MHGWVWIIAALILGALEIVLPGWFFLGIALAVGVMGLAILVGIWTGGLPMALVVTAALSGVIWLGLRRVFGSSRGDVRIWTRDINEDE